VATGPIAEAAVQIVPSFTGFSSAVQAGITKALADAQGAIAEAFTAIDEAAAEAAGGMAAVFEEGAAVLGEAVATGVDEAAAALGTLPVAAEGAMAGVAGESEVAGEGLAAGIDAGVQGALAALAELPAAAEIALAAIPEEAAAAGAATSAEFAGLSASATGATGAVGGLLGGIKGLAAAAGLGIGLKLASDFQQVEVAFRGVLGSTQAADENIRELRDFVAHTPFRFEDIAHADQQLLALGHSALNARDILGTIGNAAAAVGAHGDAFEGVVRAMSLIEARGKLAARQLLQIQTNLPNVTAISVLNNIAEAMGKTEVEVAKLANTGGVAASVAIPAIIKAMKEVPGAEGALIRQSLTLRGVMSSLKDDVIFAVQDGFNPLVKSLSDTLHQMEATTSGAGSIRNILASSLAPLGAGLGDVFAQIIDGVQAAAPTFQHLSEAAGNLLSALSPLADVGAHAFSTVGEAAANLSVGITGVVGPLVRVVDVLAQFSALSGVAPVLEAIAGGFLAFKIVSGLTSGISGVAEALRGFVTVSEAARVAMPALISADEALAEAQVASSAAATTLIEANQFLAASTAELELAMGGEATAAGLDAAALTELAAAKELAGAASATAGLEGGAGLLGGLAGAGAGAAEGLAAVAGPAAIAAAGIAAVGIGATALSKELAGASPSVNDFSNSLAQLGTTGQVGGALFDAFGPQLAKLAPELKTVADNAGGLWDQFNRGQEAGAGTDPLGGIANVFGNILSPSVRKARQDVDAFDKALAGVVTSGNPQEAANLIAALAKESGLSTEAFEKSLGPLNDYKKAVDDATRAANLAELAKTAPTVDNVTKALQAGKVTFAESLIQKVAGTAQEAVLREAFQKTTAELAQQKREAQADQQKMKDLGLATDDTASSQSNLETQINAALSAAKSAHSANKDLADANTAVTEAQKKLSDLQNKGTVDTNALTNATHGLAEANKGLRQAQEQAGAARKALDELLKPATLREMADATDAVTAAQIAQERQQLSAGDAAAKLAAAQAAQQKAQAALDKAGPTASQAKLDALNKAVADSSRAVTDAQLDVEQSTLDQHKAAEGLTDAQKALNDEQNKGTVDTPEIVNARKAVEDAEQSVTDALDRQRDAQEKLNAAQQPDPARVAAIQAAQDALKKAQDRAGEAATAANQAAKDAGLQQDFLTGKITETDLKYLTLKSDIEAADIPKVVKGQIEDSLKDLLPDLSITTLQSILGVTSGTKLDQLMKVILANPNLTGQQIFDLVGLAEGAILDRPTLALLAERPRMRELAVPIAPTARSARLVEESGILPMVKPWLSRGLLDSITPPAVARVLVPTGAPGPVQYREPDYKAQAKAMAAELADLLEEFRIQGPTIQVTSQVVDPTVLAAKIANRWASRARR
jgi:tape measure domain-containing protein